MNLAHAYAEVLKEDPTESNLKRLIAYMKERGHLSLLPQVTAILERAPDTTRAVVKVAKEKDAKKFEREIRAALDELGQKERTVIVDESLVGGYSVVGSSRSIDRSYRKALVTIYQNTIS